MPESSSPTDDAADDEEPMDRTRFMAAVAAVLLRSAPKHAQPPSGD